MNSYASKERAGQPRQFATTRWSLILSAANSQSEEQKARDALEELCRIYWRPVFVFVCRRGYSMEDAKDLTQDFFLKILERNWLQHADVNRGGFRSLLLTSLQNFLVKAAEKTHARKRGGDLEFVSWDDGLARRARARRLRPAGIISFLFPSASNGLERDHGSAGRDLERGKAFAVSGCMALRLLHGAPDEIGNNLA
jgi:hypothetical protein